MKHQLRRQRRLGFPRGRTDGRATIRLRPACETLEVRRLLSTALSWISTSSSDWGTAANWNPAQTPASGDTLQFNSSSAVPTSSNTIPGTNQFNVNFGLSGFTLAGSPFQLDGGSAIVSSLPASPGSDTIQNDLSLAGSATIVESTAGTALDLGGTLTSSSGQPLTVQGAGLVDLMNTAVATNLAGGLVDQGLVQVDTMSGPASVSLDGGSLRGTGSLGAISATANGGNLSPGDSTGSGTLTATSVTLNSGSTFDAILNGAGPGLYSQLDASGTVNLNNAELSITLNYAPSSTDSYVLVQNTSNAPVQGTFNNMPQGSTETIGGTQFVINYHGGPAGNEVVLSVNGPPVANPDFYTLPENDQNFSVFAPGILGNDTDPAGHTLHPILVTSPVHGTLTLNDDGSFSYVPATGFTGSDTFTYEASDGLLSSAPTTVKLVVNPVNGAPTVASPTYSVVENNALSVPSPGVLAGSVSPQGLPLTAYLLAGPSHGTIVWSGVNNGSFSYTPAPGYTGTDSFSFYAADSNGLTSAPGTVTLNVQDVASKVVSGAYSGNENSSITVAAPGILTGVTNPTGNPLSAVLINGAANGTVALNPDGSFIYTPNANFSGTDSFTFQATDGTLNSNTATVVLTIKPANVAPITAPDSFSLLENSTLTVAAPGLLLNDQNPSGGSLTLVVVNGPLHGTFSVAPQNDGSFTYVPNTNFSGTDSFSYYLQSNGLNSNVSDVTLTVTQVPVAPVASNDAYSTQENGKLTVAAPGVLGNDKDPNGGLLTAVLTTSPANGSLTLNGDGSFTYVPNTNFSGTDSFTYQASNGVLLSSAATVTLTVNQVAIAPTAANQAYAVQENGTLAVAPPGLLLNSQNANGGALSVIVVSPPLHGTFTAGPQNDGSFTYVPSTNFSGTDSFTYYLQKGGQTSNVATATITVAQVPVAPIARNDTYTTNENAALSVAAPGVLGNDTDPNGLPLSAILQTGPAHGTLQLNADGSFVYSPAPNFNGSDSFTYLAYDGKLESNVATVSLTVAAVVLPPTTGNSTYSMQADDQLVVPAPGILGNASDPQGLALQAVLVNPTLDGSLALNPDGSFTYTPHPGFVGTDSFTFKASDGQLESNLSTVTIAVAGIPGTTVQLAPGIEAHNGFTNVTTPSFVGTTLPGLEVLLHAQAPGGPATVVGKTMADASGHYTVGSSSLADGSYSFWVDAVRPNNGLSTGSVNAGILTIDTVAPKITDIFIVPRTGQIMISFNGGVSGMDLATLVNPANYSFSRKSTPGPRDYVITSVTLVPPASSSGPVNVALRSSVGNPIPRGRYLFAILSGGISDNAGNRLAGNFTGGFPTGGAAGAQFNAIFLSKNQRPSNPHATGHFIPVLTTQHARPLPRFASPVAVRHGAAVVHRAATDPRPAGPLALHHNRHDHGIAPLLELTHKHRII